ncbi:MAG: EamA family transporter [Acidobacteria bacterium]|nr:EamA family transporter [Acidobacteriota bacterium]
MDDRVAAEAVLDRPLMAAERKQSLVGAWIAYATICIVWGTTFLAVRVAIETIPTLLVTAVRFLGAGTVLLVIALVTGARFPKGWRSWRDQAVNGVMMVAIGNTLIVWAEHWMSSGLAALLNATIPIWMALLQTLAGGSVWTPKKILGLGLGFGGVALLVAPELGSPDISLQFFLGVAAMQGSAIFWNLGTLHSRRRQHEGDPTAIGAMHMLSGGASIVLFAAVTGQDVSWQFSSRSVIALLYLMLFGSVLAYSAYLHASTKLPAGKVASYAYVNPVVAILVGSLILSEAVTPWMIVAMVVILAGVAIIQLESRSGPVVMARSRAMPGSNDGATPDGEVRTGMDAKGFAPILESRVSSPDCAAR